jgi:hypothetical protein
MAEVDDKTAAEVVRLRDEEGMPWKDISKTLELSAKGSPKKARRIYEQAKGTAASPAPRSEAPKRRKASGKASPAPKQERVAQDSTETDQPAPRKRKRRSRAAQAAHGVTLKQAEAVHREGSKAQPVFDDDHTEDDLVAILTGHTIVVHRTIPGLNGRMSVDDYRVHRVTGFGISVQRGYRYVQFVDQDSKHRTVGVPEIVGVV